MKQKFFCLLLALCLVVGALPLSAFAQGQSTPEAATAETAQFATPRGADIPLLKDSASPVEDYYYVPSTDPAYLLEQVETAPADGNYLEFYDPAFCVPLDGQLSPGLPLLTALADFGLINNGTLSPLSTAPAEEEIAALLDVLRGDGLVNNGTLKLPFELTANEIKELNLGGDGIVEVVGHAYDNNGRHAINGDLDLAEEDHSDATLTEDGYTWAADTQTLTLGGVYIRGDLYLPSQGTSCILTQAPSIIAGSVIAGSIIDDADGDSDNLPNLSFSGTATLDTDGLIGATGSIEIKGGAVVSTCGILSLNFNDSDSLSRGDISISGSGTTVTVRPIDLRLRVRLVDFPGVFGVNISVTKGATLTTQRGLGALGTLTMDDTVKIDAIYTENDYAALPAVFAQSLEDISPYLPKDVSIGEYQFMDYFETKTLLAQDGAPATSVVLAADAADFPVRIGMTTLKTGLYVPAVDPPDYSGDPDDSADIRLVDKVTSAPANGNYLEFDADTATLTVHGTVPLTSGGPTVLNGTLTLTGAKGSRLTANSSYHCAVGKLTLAGSVSLTAESDAPALFGSVQSAPGYSGNVVLKGHDFPAIAGSVHLTTTGDITLESGESLTISPNVEEGPVELRGNNVTITNDDESDAPLFGNCCPVTIHAAGDLTLSNKGYPLSELDYVPVVTVGGTGTWTQEDAVGSFGPKGNTFTALPYTSELLTDTPIGSTHFSPTVATLEGITANNATLVNNCYMVVTAIIYHDAEPTPDPTAALTAAFKNTKIVNNGIMELYLTLTVQDVIDMDLSGIGVLTIDFNLYDNYGNPLKLLGDFEDSGLDLSGDEDHSGATLEDDGYTWDPATQTLTLDHLYVFGNVLLPGTGTSNIVAQGVSIVAGTVEPTNLHDESAAPSHLSFYGTAPLSVGIIMPTGSSQFKDGAKVTTKGIISTSSIAVSGSGTTVTVIGGASPLLVPTGMDIPSVLCTTLALADGATLNVNNALFVNDGIALDSDSVVHAASTTDYPAVFGKTLASAAPYLPQGYSIGEYVNEALNDGNPIQAVLDQNGSLAASVVLRHRHQFDTLNHDEDGHWYECTCGERQGEESHTFAWVIDQQATTAAAGTKHQECTVCGYQLASVAIPALVDENDDDDDEDDSPADTAAPTVAPAAVRSPKTSDESILPYWFALLFVSACGTGAAFAARRKQQRRN